MADFLLEIGLEEIPARMIPDAQAELARRVEDLLERERLVPADRPLRVQGFATPRRLAVLAEGLLPRQSDHVEELTGPAWKIAYPVPGQPSAAALAFAKKAGVAPESLRKVATPKGDYAGASRRHSGRSAEEVLAAGLAKEIAALTWPKSMYWRPNKPERFIRPLRWLLCLLDERVAPIEFAGIRAGDSSYGHRVLFGDAPLVIRRPAEYLRSLEGGFVLVDPSARRDRVRESLERLATAISGARCRQDDALIEQVVHLTEWPTVLCGSFDSEYLELPAEVLVTVMRDHQKYFAVEDAHGRLLPHFLAVLNTEVDATGLCIIRHGNERVLRARFNDARFFWNHDQKIPLAARVEGLKAITFQKDLGSYFQKTEINVRVIRALAAAVADRGVHLDAAAAEQAALLAKTDLSTELVKEFTELQGIVGGLYARAQGLGETVAQAMYAQYLPAAMDDPIPASVEGQLLGLADRAATLVEMFAVGLEPSGSKDPFALRRAANGVVKILADSGLPLTLNHLQEIAAGASRIAGSASSRSALAVFLQERLEHYLRETRGYAYDVVNAVLATGSSTIPDALARAEALSNVRGSDDLVAVAAAFKRIRNILRQAAEAGELPGESIVDSLLVEAAEQGLFAAAAKLAPGVEDLRGRREYARALQSIATLRPYVDGFFDKVMVMAEVADLRRNRLALIQSLLNDFSRIADFSEIVPG